MPEKEKQTEETEEPKMPEHPLDAQLKKRLLEIQEEFFRNDAALGTFSESEEFDAFFFSISDTANTAKAIKGVCEAFGITMDEFFAAYGFDENEEDEEEGEEEEGGEEEEEEAAPEPPKKRRPILDDEFLNG
jgi:hypothetical protein